jgi:hypothetical protein
MPEQMQQLREKRLKKYEASAPPGAPPRGQEALCAKYFLPY